MEFFALSGLFNAIAAIGLASFVYLRSPQDPRHWTFGLFGISTAVWSLGYFAWQISGSEDSALLYVRLLMAGAIFIPITFLHHVFYLLKKETSGRNIIRINYGIGLGFLLLDMTPLYIEGVRAISIFPYWGIPGPAFHLCLVWWVGLVVYAHVLLIHAYRSEKGLRRRQFLYLILGSGIGYLGGATNYPLWYGIELLPYGNAGFALYIAVVAYTLLRFRWLDFSVYVERGLSYFTLLLLVSQPVYPALLLAQKTLLGGINVRFSVIQLILHVLTVAGAYQMKVGTKGAVARTIMKGRELRVQTLAKFSSQVSTIQNVPDLGRTILETLGKNVGASNAAIFILDIETNRFRATAHCGFSDDAPMIRNGWNVSDDLPQFLLFSQGDISTHSLKQDPSDQWGVRISTVLEEQGLERCYPIFGNNRLLGFLAFGPCSPERIHAFGGEMVWNAIIQESALALENAILREEVHRSQNMFCHLDRLRSLETMANGLSQELHNPLVSIKAFVQVAEMRRQDEAFLDRLHQIVGEDLEKIEELTKEIKDYVKPITASSSTKVQVHEVIDSCLLFLASNSVYHHILIEKNYDSKTPMVFVDRQSVMQAIFNGLLFLLKDSPEVSGTVQISTRTIPQVMGEIGVEVEIGWKATHAAKDGQLVALEDWDYEGALDGTEDPSLIQGVVLANQIIQRHSGCFHLRLRNNVILGFQFQLPLNLSQAIGAYHPSPVSSLPGPGFQPQVNPKDVVS